MTYSQEIYDAVRSKIVGGNINEAIQEIVRETFDNLIQRIEPECQNAVIMAQEVETDRQKPSVLFRPKLAVDGDMWCALYGANLQDGVAGFGESPALAMAAFDKAWIAHLTKECK